MSKSWPEQGSFMHQPVLIRLWSNIGRNNIKIGGKPIKKIMST